MVEQRGAAISVEHVVKTYGATRAVDGLSFAVAPGEVFALLGPNGAGKTTTVEMLEGYYAPNSGTVRVLGLDPIREARKLKLQIGVMLQADGLQPSLTARELLRLYAAFFPDPLDPDELIARVGLAESAKTRCRRLSGGQKRRLALAVALVGQPRLVFLDEPTTGMDPQARLATWEIVQTLRASGTTILLTTHLLDEAERLADRVAIIDRGGSSRSARRANSPGRTRPGSCGLWRRRGCRLTRWRACPVSARPAKRPPALTPWKSIPLTPRPRWRPSPPGCAIRASRWASYASVTARWKSSSCN